MRHPINGFLFQVDPENVDFYVLGIEAPLVGGSKVEVLDISLPDWAWIVIFGGAISFLIIALLGCTVGCNR